jgi:aspartate-semialdehyde dehydrogenase
VNIEFESDINIEDVIEILDEQESIIVHSRDEDGGYAVQCDNAGSDAVYVSRIRRDNSFKNCINIWIVCDNIRKGSALNGVQIAEKLVENF